MSLTSAAVVSGSAEPDTSVIRRVVSLRILSSRNHPVLSGQRSLSDAVLSGLDVHPCIASRRNNVTSLAPHALRRASPPGLSPPRSGSGHSPATSKTQPNRPPNSLPPEEPTRGG